MKSFLILMAGIIVGALLCYGYLWYQVYENFNKMWTCQVFTGELSVDEKERCQK